MAGSLFRVLFWLPHFLLHHNQENHVFPKYFEVWIIPTRGTSFLFLFVPLNTLLTLNHLWLKLYNPPVILMFLVGTILKLRLKHILFLCGEPSFGGYKHLTDTIPKVPKRYFLCAKRTPKRTPKNQTVRVIMISA